MSYSSKRGYMSPSTTRIRTYQSALTNVKYPDENGKKPLPFNPATAEEDSVAKYHRRSSEGEWVPRDESKYNFDC